jgi:hypothetical protein
MDDCPEENPMGRFSRSWLLFKSSLSVIAQNQQLLLFPIVIAVLSTVITLFFFAPALLWPTGHSYTSLEHWRTIADTFFTPTTNTSGGNSVHFTASPAATAYLVLVYFVSMFLATFFNVAFYNEILAALSGKPVSLGRGFSFACSRLQAIFLWTLFAGIIGLIIKLIERRLNFVGRIIARFIGVAWSIASVFAIPVIVRDQQTVNPFAVLRKSADALRRTWGEALIGYVGMGFISVIFFFASLVLFAVAAFAAIQANNFLLLAIGAGIWLLALIAWSYLMNVAGLVYKGALYLYAAEGVVAAPYSQEMLNAAWKFKRR